MQSERVSAYKAAPAAMRAVQQAEAYIRGSSRADMTMTENNAPSSRGDWKLVEPAGLSFRRATVHALCWMYDWGNRVARVAAALSVPFFLYVAVYIAPAEQRIAQQHERDVIERENIAFCEKHGMPVGTREYALCAEDLTYIRTKQSQRTTEEMERTF